jgi:hypothetical protein
MSMPNHEFLATCLTRLQGVLGRHSCEGVASLLSSCCNGVNEAIADAELNVLRHTHFNRPQDAARAQERLDQLREDQRVLTALLTALRSSRLSLAEVFADLEADVAERAEDAKPAPAPV